jgi:hypothetical protein
LSYRQHIESGALGGGISVLARIIVGCASFPRGP